MDIPITILCVDDRKDAYLLIARHLAEHNIKTIYAKSTKEMLKILPDIYHKLTAITLDIIGKKTNEQSSENKNFIVQVMAKLDREPEYKDIERIIVSGSPEAYNEIKEYYTDYKIFSKDLEDLEELAKYVLKLADRKEEIKIRRNFSRIFDIFNKLKIPSEFERVLQNILIEQETNDISKIKVFLVEIRKIHEYIYKDVSNKIEEIKKATHFKEINKCLAGYRDYSKKAKITKTFYYEDIIVENASQYIHWVGSLHGAHPNKALEEKNVPVNTENYPTNYTLKTALYSLLDIIIWYDIFLRKYGKE